MSALEYVKKLLAEQYGIKTAKQLDEALRKMAKPDISVFVAKPTKAQENG